MKITDWFDPTVIEHIKAYHHLQLNGFWPNGFLPNGIEMPSRWQVTIQAKIANQWINLLLHHQMEGK